MTCENCGEPIPAGRQAWTVRYCGDKCKWAAKSKRHRARHPEQTKAAKAAWQQATRDRINANARARRALLRQLLAEREGEA